MRETARAIILNGDQLLLMDRNNHGRRYLALVGGGIDEGETPQQAVLREIDEETTVSVEGLTLVATIEPFANYGKQYIFVCKYVSGQAKLGPSSIETKLNQTGDNLYQPSWFKTNSLSAINLLPPELKQFIANHLESGWPDRPTVLAVAA